MADDNAVRISNREIFDGLMALTSRVADVQRDIDSIKNAHADFGKRIRSLEIRFYVVAAGLLGGLVSVIRIGVGG